ncbi:hypothetical protein PG997_011356 [Apiospora hydei]|uniref:Laccase n=1 Tax=Apiospora hydei TaxID=1337664 RepID=A0ABR1VIW1_9PEZI
MALLAHGLLGLSVACQAMGAAAAAVRGSEPCENTATSRRCWGEYSIDTDWLEEAPRTGNTREYWLTAEETVLAPDGYLRPVMAFNGSIPGPTIEADWETITSIHWHGMHQKGSVAHDGVPGVTQCPIVPGSTMTYRFQATQYGTAWYHSHFSLQLAEGLFGPIVIHGPATANYDVDLGPVMVMDWPHVTAWETWETYQHRLALVQPVAANGLINGMNPYDCSKTQDPACVGNTTARYEVSFEKGLKYRFRVIGAQTDGYMKFAIDDHKLTVIAADLVPIRPYQADSIILASGQRYDVIVEADQPIGNYWLRAIYQTACNNNDNDNKDNILGIVRYAGADTESELTTTVNRAITNSCGDEPAESLVPWVAHEVGSADVRETIGVGWYYELDLVFKWTLHGKTLVVNWSEPTLLGVYKEKGLERLEFPSESNVVTLDAADQWVYWIIQDLGLVNAYHPLHLHGHDFYVLAQGRGAFVPGLVELNTRNPPRRDTVTLYGNGYTVIAFKTDNPGSWLFHCHIAWHASQGLAMQVVERASEIPGLLADDAADMDRACRDWAPFYHSPDQADDEQDDSGI